MIERLGELTVNHIGMFVEFNDGNNYRREGLLTKVSHEEGYNDQKRTYVAITNLDESRWAKYLSPDTALISVRATP